MNGCRYCVIMHFRRRRGRKLARGIAMCLARTELTRCEKKRYERGPGCEYHDAKMQSLGLSAIEVDGPSTPVSTRGKQERETARRAS